MEFASLTKERHKPKHVSGMTLNGGLERTLCEAVKLKSGLSWRLKDVGDDRAMGYLQRRAANRDGTSPRERAMLQSTKLKAV